MERDPQTRRPNEPAAEPVEKDEMDTSGHGDKLENAVEQVAGPDQDRGRDKTSDFERVDEEDMDITGHGDPQRRNIEKL
jgi:hypothetical protein